MKTLHKRCAGLDVHKAEVVACLRLISKRKVEREVRRFPTTTQGLLALAEGREKGGVTARAAEGGKGGMRARGDGSDGRVLEAGLAHFGRALCAHSGECRACEERTWPQE